MGGCKRICKRDAAGRAGTGETSRDRRRWPARVGQGQDGPGETVRDAGDGGRMSHNPEVAGSNPAPATKVQVRGLTASVAVRPFGCLSAVRPWDLALGRGMLRGGSAEIGIAGGCQCPFFEHCSSGFGLWVCHRGRSSSGGGPQEGGLGPTRPVPARLRDGCRGHDRLLHRVTSSVAR
jgi:hypothetical protein